MYYLISLFTGVLISAMIAFNGELTAQYGVYSATVVVHIVGLILVCILLLFNREKPFSKRQEWYLYFGGAFGVLITVLNNIAYGRISVSAILALGLLGQTMTGLLIDMLGLMGMPKHPLNKRKLIGLAFILSGIVPMITNFELIAVAASFIAGIGIAISRTLNARLAHSTSTLVGSLYNYLVGLAVAVLVYFILGSHELSASGFYISTKMYIYLGGLLGVVVILLSNATVMKISAFYLSLFLFIGQVFSGVLIDAFISHTVSIQSLAGGVFASIGLFISLDKK